MERYVLSQLIGEGSFGKCYLAIDSTTSEHVAVKEVPKTGSVTEAEARKMHEEYTMLIDLRHPHVVGVKGFEVTNGKAYISMEWVPGGTIENVMKKFRFRLHEGLIRKYARQILMGLAFLHSKKVVHRDVKPSNVLVASDGSLKLSDFGTAKALAGSMQSTLHVMGTVPYMSPETVQGECCAAMDIWALGCCLVEMATGAMPWAEKTELRNPMQLMFHIGSGKCHPVIPSHLSECGRDFITRCFVFDSRKRPSCADLLTLPFVTTAEESDPTMEDLASYTRQRTGCDTTRSLSPAPAETVLVVSSVMSPVPAVAPPAVIGVCKSGHLLSVVNAKPKGYPYWPCDTCKRAIPHNAVGVLHCAICKYDVCSDCRSRSPSVSVGRPSLGKIITKMSTTEDVTLFLAGLNLSKDYSSIVQTQNIDGDVIFGVTDSELQSLGIAPFGDRKKISNAIQKCQE